MEANAVISWRMRKEMSRRGRGMDGARRWRREREGNRLRRAVWVREIGRVGVGVGVGGGGIEGGGGGGGVDMFGWVRRG